MTEERNKFSDKEPAEVYIIDYTYENLGYEGDIQDLFLTPERVIDEGKELGYKYPASTVHSPQPTPIGAMCSNAQYVYGVNNVSNEVVIMFEKYDNDNKNQKVRFKCPVIR